MSTGRMIALLSDIHGNREALTACLADAAKRGAERYVFLGDCVGYGADPAWVLDQVAAYVERGATVILGNHDAAILTPSSRMNPVAQEAIAWTRSQLDEKRLAFIRRMPLLAEDGNRLYVHANAHAPDGWEYIYGAAEAERSMRATTFPVIICGHLHVPSLYHRQDGRMQALTPAAGAAIAMTEGQWLAVLGAVGQPRDHNVMACYGLYDEARDTLTYIRVPYDVQTAAAKVRAAGLPYVLSHRLLAGY